MSGDPNSRKSRALQIELLDAGRSKAIDYELLTRIANHELTTVPSVLNVLAQYVARNYAAGDMSFQQGDAIMNAAFNASTTEQFLAAHDHAIPEAMFQVYQAFDEGEYCHSKAGAEVDPETKYTKPLIQAFLAKFRD